MSRLKVENKHLNFVKNFIDSLDLKDKIAVDATLGKANDTLLLSEKVGVKGEVYAFDIQKEAIEYSRDRLKRESISNVRIIEDSHEFVDKYLSSIDFAIFNLGYLPSFNKDIITKGSSTSRAVHKISKLLSHRGIIAITLYTGHEGSDEEKFMLERELGDLDQKVFSVQKISFFNQQNNPPIVYLIEKYGGLYE